MVIRVWWKRNDVYFKHCKVLKAESKNKKKDIKADQKVVHVEWEEEKDSKLKWLWEGRQRK